MSDYNLSLGRKGKSGDFDSKEVKAGTRKSDLQSKTAQNIFDAFDNDKDGTLNEIEVEKMLAQIKDAAKNNTLSVREAKKLLKLEGVKGAKAEQLFDFLKEMSAVNPEESYSAYQGGAMGVELSNSSEFNDNFLDDVINQVVSDKTDLKQSSSSEVKVPPLNKEDVVVIDNSKSVCENGRIVRIGDDGKSILVQNDENSEPVKLQTDDDGNIISYAKNGESFVMTAKRLGLKTEGEVYERFKELNQKAAKNGYFLVGGKVRVPAEAVENLALDKVNVNSDNEIAAYNKFMAEKAKKSQQNNDDVNRAPSPAGEDKPDVPPANDFKPEQKQEKTPSGNPFKLSVTKEDFDDENLSKRYEPSKYKKVHDGNTLRFINKQTGKIALAKTKFGDNGAFVLSYKNGKPDTSMEIDASGLMKRRQYEQDGSLKSEALYDGTTLKLKSENFRNSDGILTNSINYNENGIKTSEILYRSEKENDYLKKEYQSDGTLIATYDVLSKTYDCPVAKELKELIYAKNSIGLPVSKREEIKDSIMNKINDENAVIIQKAYKSMTGVELLKDLGEEWSLSAAEIKSQKEHINKCMENPLDYKDKFENTSSKIENPYHSGDEFAVKQDGDTITVKNKTTGREHQLDLNRLTARVDADKRVQLKQIIQGLPGEVLEDLCIEMDRMTSEDTYEEYAGWYTQGKTSPLFGISLNGTDLINMRNINPNTLVHELGHAIDYNGFISNTSTIGENENFQKTIKKEMDNYLAKGNKCYESDDINSQYSVDKYYNYCTANEREMFAECYTLLMMGDCNSKNCILTYFPETLNAVKEHLQYVRNLPESKRH